jgi:hypothetical protein
MRSGFLSAVLSYRQAQTTGSLTLAAWRENYCFPSSLNRHLLAFS